MTDLVKELSRLKSKMEERKLAKAEATGRLDELYRQLRINFNCDSLAEAEAYKQEELLISRTCGKCWDEMFPEE